MKLYDLTFLETMFFSEITKILWIALFSLLIIFTILIAIGKNNEGMKKVGESGAIIIGSAVIILIIFNVVKYQKHDIQYVSMNKEVPIVDIQEVGGRSTDKNAILEMDGKKYKYTLPHNMVATKGDTLHIKSNKDLVLLNKDNRIIERNNMDTNKIFELKQAK